jgi:polyhydroxyalkanoate synthesis regulator phasin
MEKPMQFEQRPDDGLGGGNTEQTENIEDRLSFEWGPELGKMSWADAKEKIAELNKTLKEDEKPWRLPSKEEWEEILKPFTEAKEKGVLEEELQKILEEIRKTNNLQSCNYWSSSTYFDDSDDAWIVYMNYGNFYNDNKDHDDNLVRCVH